MDQDQNVKENAPAEPFDEAKRAKIQAALAGISALQAQIGGEPPKPVTESGELEPRDPIPMLPVKLGLKAKDATDWTDRELPHSRYLITAQLWMLQENVPDDLAWCSDVPEGTPGCSKVNPTTVKELFKLYSDGKDSLLRRDIETPLQETVLKLFKESPLISVAVTLTRFQPDGNIQAVSIGYENSAICYGKAGEVSAELLTKCTVALGERLSQAQTGGIIVPKGAGDIIIPGR
jgi:hypothetical protein